MNPIDKIIEEFDFEIVESVMQHLKWGWAINDSNPPTIEQLKNTARRILEDCHNSPENEMYIRTGGLCATKMYGNRLTLSFELEYITEML